VGVDHGAKPFTRYAQSVWLKVRPAAYIYTSASDLSAYQSFKSLLSQVAIPLQGVPMSAVTTTNWSQYRLIIVGADTGYTATWGTPAMVTALMNSRLPVIGLGTGGHALFGKIGLAIGYPNGSSTANITRTLPVSAAMAVWNTPFTLSGAAPYVVYTATSAVVVPFSVAPVGVELVGRVPPSHSTLYNIVVEDNRYALWAFQQPASQMTQNGRRLFLNLVKKVS
jgi:hypothetical protein